MIVSLQGKLANDCQCLSQFDMMHHRYSIASDDYFLSAAYRELIGFAQLCGKSDFCGRIETGSCSD
jgi:hypothetical protein